MELSLEQWGILYGMVLSTLGVGWQCIKWLSERPRISISFHDAGTESRSGYERHYLNVTIKNERYCNIRVDSWGVERPTKGEGPLAVFQGLRSNGEGCGLPSMLGPYESVTLKLDRLEFLAEREPEVIYAQDWKGKKWKACEEQVRAAIEKAKSIVEKNKVIKKPGIVMKNFH